MDTYTPFGLKDPKYIGQKTERRFYINFSAGYQLQHMAIEQIPLQDI